MDLEAIVVDCRIAKSGACLGWEVTLIFDSVTPAQVSALRAASRIHQHHEPFPKTGSYYGTAGFFEPGLN